MKKSLFLAVILAGVLAGESYGQVKSESYKKFKSWSSVQSSSSTLLEEANRLKNIQPGEALNKVEEALGISLAQGDKFNEGKSYELIGEINEGIQEWKLAMENYLRAYETLRGAYATSAEYLRTLKGLGNAHLKLGRYEASLKYYEMNLDLESATPQRHEIWLAISEVYYQMTKYDDALLVLSNISGNAADPSIINRVENQKAKIYARKNDLERSKDLYQNSLNTLRENKSAAPAAKQSLQNAKEEIVDVLRGQRKYDEEIDLRNQSIEYNLESKDITEVAKDKVEIGKTLVAKGDPLAALRETEEAAKLAETLDNPKEQANAFLALADLYERNGRAPQALAAYRKFSVAVASAEKRNEIRLAEKSDLINKQKDIEELSKNIFLGRGEETIEKATVFRQQIIIYGLLLIILIVATTSYFVYRSAQASKLANQLLALKSLRSQMNPHFIFNALNSVNHFIAQQDERAANKFLSEFSQLMRLVLENSQEDFIPLEKEKEILSLYLKLEHYRFRDKFTYSVEIDPDLPMDTIVVPPMLIQPYIENAVWHGLRYKEGVGNLKLRFCKMENELIVEVTDDGIGRAKSSALKTENQKKHQSTGLKNIEERLSIINKVYKASYRVTIEDIDHDSGTRVIIHLPLNSKTRSAK